MIEAINIFTIIAALTCSYAAVTLPSLISGSFLMGALSFFLAILWSILAAPDVSFTEAVVGAGASTIFLLLALFGTNHAVKKMPRSKNYFWALAATVALGAFLLWGSSDLPAFGNLGAVASNYLSPHYLTHAYHETHTPNVVTAVVVDYRSFDTLIEATVVFTAGVACLLIFRKEEEL